MGLSHLEDQWSGLMMDGWTLKCFYCLVCLGDEVCGLEVVRDEMDGKWIEKKKSRKLGFL